MNVKNNRRSRETEEWVEEVFLQLLSKKHISTITVRELCEGAHITRTSFYGHYKDVYDLLEKVQNRMTMQLIEIFRAEWSDNSGDIHIAFVQTFRYMEKNKVFFRYFLKNADMNTVFSAGQMTGLFANGLSLEKKLPLTFFVGGLNALLIYWLENDCAETAEEIFETLPEQYVQLL